MYEIKIDNNIHARHTNKLKPRFADNNPSTTSTWKISDWSWLRTSQIQHKTLSVRSNEEEIATDSFIENLSFSIGNLDPKSIVGNGAQTFGNRQTARSAPVFVLSRSAGDSLVRALRKRRPMEKLAVEQSTANRYLDKRCAGGAVGSVAANRLPIKFIF